MNKPNGKISKCNLLLIPVLLILTIAQTTTPMAFASQQQQTSTSEVPTLAVEPEQYTASHIGETFQVNITISNVNASSELIGVHFRLLFNTSFLRALEMKEGTFLEQFVSAGEQGIFYTFHEDVGVPIYGDEVVGGAMIFPDMNGSWHAPFPEGNGTVCSIVFNVTARPPAKCKLQLVDTMLIDKDQNEIDHNVKDHTHYELHETLSHIINYGRLTFNVVTTSNSSISAFEFYDNTRTIRFKATADEYWTNTTGFCNVTIPKDLMSGSFTVWIDDVSVAYDQWSNTTHAVLHFLYPHSTHNIQIKATTGIKEDLKDIAYAPLDVKVGVGALHFRGELDVKFYVQTSLKGVAINVTDISAELHKPDGTVESLTTERIGTGFYKIEYDFPGDAPTGTYALIVSVDYATTVGTSTKIETSGTSFECFQLSPTLTNMNAMIEEINGTVATVVIPNLGAIKANLTAINAKLDAINGTTAWIQTNIGTIKTDIANIKLNVTAINGNVATIQTTLGTIEGKITSIDGNTATIETDIGTLKEDVSDIIDAQEALTTPVYAATILALIAAVAAIAIIFLIRRKS